MPKTVKLTAEAAERVLDKMKKIEVAQNRKNHGAHWSYPTMWNNLMIWLEEEKEDAEQ